MFSKDFSLCALFDRYGALLTEKQQTAFSLYYNEDFSLSEIAEHTGTSRQAVRSLITKTQEQLLHMEQVLCLCQKEERIQKLSDALSPTLSTEQADTLKEILSVLKE